MYDKVYLSGAQSWHSALKMWRYQTFAAVLIIVCIGVSGDSHGPHDYLIRKWKLWYSSLDVNHDGKVSFEDVKEARNKFTYLHELVGDKAKEVNIDFKKWWNLYIFRTGSGKEISETEFVESLKAAYTKDKSAFKAEIQKCFGDIFDVINANDDRFIDQNEFICAFKAFGHENKPLERMAFACLKPRMALCL